jgi:hypothetical protein
MIKEARFNSQQGQDIFNLAIVSKLALWPSCAVGIVGCFFECRVSQARSCPLPLSVEVMS